VRQGCDRPAQVIARQVIQELAADVAGVVDVRTWSTRIWYYRPAMTTSGLKTAGWRWSRSDEVTVDRVRLHVMNQRERRTLCSWPRLASPRSTG